MHHLHHRVIFKQSPGVRRAVSKIEQLPASSARRSIAVAAAIVCLSATSAWAAGGNGGAGGSATDVASPGGVGATVGDGGDGAAGSLASGQGGGGGGGGAASRTGIVGGAGGRGGAGSSQIEPGTGLPYIGAGSDGGRAGNAGALRGGDIAADIAGSNGERALFVSVQSYDVAGGGGGGGEGGVGLIMPAASSARVLGGVEIRGGSGGSGGPGGYITSAGIGTAGSGGAGGAGGVGVYMSSGTTLINDGAIFGGQGGFEGSVGGPVIEKVSPTPGGNGAGGIAVVANGGLIDNGGSIIGGAQFLGATSPAVFFNSGDTTLRLRAGTIISGALAVGPNASATIQAATNGLKLDGGLILDGPATVSTDGFTLEVNSTISGAASLTKSGAGTLLLSASNTYTGATTVAGGTLQAGAPNAFGSTASMTVAAGGALDLNGYSQSVASLAGAGLLSFGTPNGQTPVGGPDLSVGNSGVDSVYDGQVVGSGSFTKVGPGTLSMGGAAQHIGSTSVNAGTLRATAAGVFSPAAFHTIAAGATLDTGGFDQTVAGLTNSGTVSLIGNRAGSTLTVTGPFVGNAGVLRMGTFLGDSSSTSDRLVLSGPNATATGTTNIQITSLGGLGAPTVGNGIEIVRALNGATTTAQTTKSAFSLAGGHVDAGAFEYRLYPADANGTGESWYLRSATANSGGMSGGGILPGNGNGNGNGNGPGLDSGDGFGLGAGFGSGFGPGGSGGGTSVVTYRVEVPLLAALPEQMRQANAGMLASLHRRVGDDRAGGPSDAAQHDRRAWGRLISTRPEIKQGGTVSASSEGRLSGFQAGTDLWASESWNAGLYVGQLDGDLQVRGFARGIDGLAAGSNSLSNDYLGAYATWRGDGYYIDSVLQYGRHRYEVHPYSALPARGRAQSTLASVEVGKSFDLGEGWKLEPQLQLVGQRIDFDAIGIVGAHVSQDANGGLTVRAGVRVSGDVATSAGRLKPYGRINFYRTSNGADATVLAGLGGSTAIRSDKAGTSADIAGGFTLALGPSVALYGELGRQWATGGSARMASALQLGLGAQWRW